MGTNCAPFVADLFLFCYDRDFITSLSDDNQADIIETFKSTSRYLDDLLNIDNHYFERIYPPLQLNKANTSVARFTERLISYLSPKTYLTTHLRPKTCLILKICIKTCHKSILVVN